MIFKEKIGVQSVRLAIGVLAGTVMLSGMAQAQEEKVFRKSKSLVLILNVLIKKVRHLFRLLLPKKSKKVARPLFSIC
jgi:hypothetical protein